MGFPLPLIVPRKKRGFASKRKNDELLPEYGVV